MENKNVQKGTRKSVAEWKKLVAEYQKPDLGRAIWQIVNTLGSIVAIWIALFFTMGISWWLTIGLSVSGLFLATLFSMIVGMDLFKSKKQQYPWFHFRNVRFHPYHHWRWNMPCTTRPTEIWTAAGLHIWTLCANTPHPA